MQLVGDEVAEYRCLSCSSLVRFFACPNCTLVQTVNKKWRSFECGQCGRKVDVPHHEDYTQAAKAMRVTGTAKVWI
jgi:primosomal protein N'